MQTDFACAVCRMQFFCLNRQSFPTRTSCFFSVHWCLTKCIGSHSSCIDETTLLLNIPVFSSGGLGRFQPALQANGSPNLAGTEGGERQQWDAVPASPQLVWLEPVLGHIKKGVKDPGCSESGRSSDSATEHVGSEFHSAFFYKGCKLL